MDIIEEGWDLPSATPASTKAKTWRLPSVPSSLTSYWYLQVRMGLLAGVTQEIKSPLCAVDPDD